MKPGLVAILSVMPLMGYSQSSFGLQIEMGNAVLTGISPDTIVPYGYSGAETFAKNKLYFSPSLRFRKSLTARFSLECGLGYIPLNQEVRLKFYHSFFKANVDTTLNISLHYLNIPITCNYILPVSANSSLLFIGALNSNVLISKKDNYEDLILEKIAWVKRDWYNPVVFVPCLSISYQTRLKGLSIVEIGIFASRDINAFVKEDVWGFYENLRTSRSTRYGIQLKYFLNI